MAIIIPVGQPVNEVERQVIGHLRTHLPDSYQILHNFEIARDDERFEVDLAILAPHAVYLVDVKGTRGVVEVHGPKWYPQGRQPFASPLLKLRSHARTLKGIIVDSQPGRADLAQVWVDAVVLLAAPDAQLVDPKEQDVGNVTTLARAAAFFQNTARIPPRYTRDVAPLYRMVRSAIQGKATPRAGPLRFGNWEVIERLGATDAYTEYRAVNLFAGARAGTVLARVYKADPYLPEPERAHQRFRISNAYQALSRLPSHPNIVAARDFFASEGEDSYVFVTEDVSGQALRLHIDKPALALTLDQKLRVADELLAALEHAHRHEVVHRNLNPSTVLLGSDGHLRLVGFDYARAGANRSQSLAGEILDDLEPAYLAPEVFADPAAASPASDVLSAGLILYELFAGSPAFENLTELVDQEGQFPVKPSQLRSDLPAGLDAWLQALCVYQPEQRPSAASARGRLAEISRTPAAGPAIEPTPPSSEALPPVLPPDYLNLPPGHQLTSKFVVEKRLGKPGAFGVVYKVIDTFGDVARAVKIIVRDRYSTLERLKKEYRTLLHIPQHAYVVRVIDADLLPQANLPIIVFEYVEGADVAEMIDAASFTPEDALALARDTVAGLVHLHGHGVYHCDIKPSNLIWTRSGVRIIDFNVAVQPAAENGHGGGSRRYLPPDLDLSAPPQAGDLADRDVYALGVTIYEAMTGRYPWDTPTPPAGLPAKDPRGFTGLDDLAPGFVEVVLKAISPRRGDRYASAAALKAALDNVRLARRMRPPSDAVLLPWLAGTAAGDAPRPNTNPYVNHLLTLYSQSRRTNAGTRGLDAMAEQTYVDTLLDLELLPAALRGEFSLVIITGNAGDGKTAFLQQLETAANKAGAAMAGSATNGRQFTLHGRTYVTNYDGSQDAGDQANDQVLAAFFAPFRGDAAGWPQDAVRLIAINEGRLVDFLTAHAADFGSLRAIVDQGLKTGAPADGVTVVNLNLRSVIAGVDAPDSSILARLVDRMTAPAFWEPCQACDLRDRCYALHNARTFQDEVAGPKVVERLQTLYTLTHLRNKRHITLRELRSALAFMLAGTRTCDEIHELYARGDAETIAQGFYFNSWLGGDAPTADRLLALLKEVDVGQVSDPQLDRRLSFTSPAEDRSLFAFAGRGGYDRDILRKLFADLPANHPGRTPAERAAAFQAYLCMARRHTFFERRDGGWQAMLPYRSAGHLQALIRSEASLAPALADLLQAMNRGEGLRDPSRLGNRLAISVRHVENGTIRSYRLFPGERFSLAVDDSAQRARFVEHLPSGLVLRYSGPTAGEAELRVNLDVFEMLERLNQGYRASVEEEQGLGRALAIFKNILGSEPYQEVLLTSTGHDFYRIERFGDGRLVISQELTEAA